MTRSMASGGVIFEHTVIGEWARTAAVDETSGVEVVVFGPAAAPQSHLEAIAFRKLERKLAETPPPSGADRGGVLI